MCVRVRVQRTGQSDQFKTVKATDFKFDTFSQRQSRHNPLKFFENGAWTRSRDPLNFWVLNANSSKMVKSTDFKFDMHVSRDSSDMSKGSCHMTPYKLLFCKNSLGGDMHSHKRLLVFSVTAELLDKISQYETGVTRMYGMYRTIL